ncbi:hypothetical protein H0I23_11530 [Cellulophaga sp. HaHaR_3_176]|uniref:hypothetical protein n=1 Tax=Cellulophaga sp. HaHaR_3_176 TaxID=1942464 RepID=UPI001C1FC654|nr:hypothetical protein [Cellulophaga sp. HaHaR_3_176]QWX83082.1 hypothetical protein H0I23_11530 [Cellulophaga sp. HaHaR_3_176]
MTQKAKSIVYFSVLVVTCILYSYTDTEESNQGNFGAIENQSTQKIDIASTSNIYGLN